MGGAAAVEVAGVEAEGAPKDKPEKSNAGVAADV